MAKLSVGHTAAEVSTLIEKVAYLCNMQELRSAEVAVAFVDQNLSDTDAESLVQQAEHRIPEYSQFQLKIWNSWKVGTRPACIHVTITKLQ